MKEIIEQIKSKNGNVSFTNKDLLWYMVAKIDKIDDRLNNQVNLCNKRFIKIEENKLNKKDYAWITGTIITIVGITIAVGYRLFI